MTGTHDVKLAARGFTGRNGLTAVDVHPRGCRWEALCGDLRHFQGPRGHGYHPQLSVAQIGRPHTRSQPDHQAFTRAPIMQALKINVVIILWVSSIHTMPT